jgi:hypothetical protein
MSIGGFGRARIRRFAAYTMTVSFLLFITFTPHAYSQKFPTCSDTEAQQKTVSLLQRWFEETTKQNSRGDIKTLAVDIQRITPRNARFGNYSGILECQVTGTVTLLKISTGERFRMQAFNNFVLYFGYDQNGNLVVQTPSGFE